MWTKSGYDARAIYSRGHYKNAANILLWCFWLLFYSGPYCLNNSTGAHGAQKNEQW